MQEADGSLHQVGNFENRRLLAPGLGLNRHIAGQLEKSALWRVITLADSRRVTDDDVSLYFAIVRRSQELLTAEYPGIQFRVILYPNQDAGQQRAIYEKLWERFGRMGIPVDLVENFLPGYNIDRSKFILSREDTHPNALANRLLAQQVLNEIGQ